MIGPGGRSRLDPLAARVPPGVEMPARSSAAKTDRILVEGIKFHAYHGFTQLEREVGVRCSIDVEMAMDLSRAMRSDRLKDTLDYREIHSLVLDIGRKRNSFHLIESLAGRIAEEILKSYRKVREVTVRVRKETPLIDGIVDYVGVEVTRKRASSRSAGKGSR